MVACPRWNKAGKVFCILIKNTNLQSHKKNEVLLAGEKVETSGLEPLTYCLQSSRSTN